MHPLGPPVGSEDDTVRQQMAQFFELTSDGIQFLNRDFVITFMNARALAILSPSGEVVGKNIWESFPEATRSDLPYYESYTRTMNERVATEFEAFYPEPLNIWFHIEAYPSDDGIIVFFRDITEDKRKHEEFRKKSEEAERQRAEIEAVYRTAPIGLALFDLDDYHYLRLNNRQAAFFGLKPEEVVGRTLTEMAPIPGLRELFDKVAAGEPIVNFPLEGALVNDPDEHRYWTVSYFPVYGADGTVTGITAASLEITNQKKAELALIESDKLAVVGRLAASIAHEINNPLESVTNLLYLAKTSQALDDAQGFLDTAERELMRVAAITSQTLRFHKQSTSPQAITAEQLIASVLSIYQGRIVNSGVEINLRHRDARAVRCFEGEVRQVISNLVGNSLDAMATGGGRMLLRSREGVNWTTGERGAVITVADTGSGMSPEVLAKVFRAFYTTKGITGTGLGLWISKEIIDRHRGTLKVRSREGLGTVFSIFLPYEAVTR
ncbi:histidine kinase with PAS domain [Terriglobus roseus DSM 18391]|uniref:histidine kinase n=1 Tax=Terriglobus roseus (strain DSM 18391 / NRRL B-41598 / KBS 63) TaxID=926566 RepID=I3ZDJ1_TERRK|nr:PAS domain-containing protein [Terriglobus roseus]AFL87309.1 histidine kinase with PAS domain [Terriglobus roseus DSM 18391]